MSHCWHWLNSKGILIESLDAPGLNALVGEVNHQGVVGACKKMPVLSERDLPAIFEHAEAAPMFLFLDQVQDPHNLGACLRTAAAAGCAAVIIPKDNAATLNATVLKVASGAVGRVPLVQVTNLVRAMQTLKEWGVWFYGAAEEGDQSIYAQNLSGPVAWVLGGEGKGLRQLTKKNCDILCQIPTNAQFSCLNVSVATGVCLFETRRQKVA